MTAHTHSHGPHSHGQSSVNRRRLTIVLALAAAYLVAEVVGGLVSHSLALLADAGHMFSDVAALALSLAALWIAERPPRPQNTFGYYRAEILAALANGATLLAISVFIFIEAWQRLFEPAVVQGPLMMGIAVGGLVVNLIGLAVLHGGAEDSLNIRGAWLHVLTDALGSVAAIVAAALVWGFGWNWADPVLSVLIGLLVIYSAWSLVMESVAVLMETAPRHIDVDHVRNELMAIEGVLAVHDLHIWSITTGREALSAHIVTAGHPPAAQLLATIRQSVHNHFGIDHITIQLEPAGFED